MRPPARPGILSHKTQNLYSVSSEHFRYFAYGSNMLSARLRAKDRAPSAQATGTGYVIGRVLTFDKAGADNSGKCDIPATGRNEDRVFGVTYDIAPSDRAALDRVEELGWGYRDELLTVLTPSGPVQALAYIATRKKPGIRPYHWYKALTIAGAIEHGLPASYIRRLGEFESMEDPDPERSRLHEALVYPANRP